MGFNKQTKIAYETYMYTLTFINTDLNLYVTFVYFNLTQCLSVEGCRPGLLRMYDSKLTCYILFFVVTGYRFVHFDF